MHRIRLTALALVLAAVLIAAAGSSAATTAPAGTPSATAPVGSPSPPAAVPGSLKLYLPGIFVVSHAAVTVPGRTVSVAGVVRPFVPGQSVEVRSYLGRRLIKRAQLRIKRAPDGQYGKFTEKLRSPRAGAVSVTVTHSATSAMGAFTARRRFSALDENVTLGATGRFVQLIQQRLAALHFYLPQSGVFDSFTGLALDAYHRVLGQGEGNQTVSPATVTDLLNGVGQFQVRFPGQGYHVEGDLTHQVLALIDGSKVQYILPISSGKPSTPTILGSYRVYERVPGYLPDGMYYSDFFIRGYAVHGYDPAPDYPASHGCMRLPIQDAIFVFNHLAIGDWVDTYYR